MGIRNPQIQAGPDRAYQRGFTLVEVLITGAIIGAVAFVAVLSAGALTSDREAQASQQELASVQTAVDTLMIKRRLAALPAVEATATNDMTRFPSPANPLYPDYVRNAKSGYKYICAVDGTVSRSDGGTPAPASGPPTPIPILAGCS
jgi:prepilin-type N-terminal cleavage/methylation domain-containing protein